MPEEPGESTDPSEPTDPAGPEETKTVSLHMARAFALDDEATEDGADEDEPVLERLEDDGILHEGVWTQVAQRRTNEDGEYSFDGLPLVDEQGKPYEYRIRMDKPEGTSYIPIHVGSDDNLDNDYAHLNVLGEITPEEKGVTDVLPVIGTRAAGPNAYGHAYTVLQNGSWNADAGRSVDLGIYKPEEPVDPEQPITPDTPVTPHPETPYVPETPATPGEETPLLKDLPKLMKLPKTGDTSMLTFMLAVLALLLALAVIKRRRDDEEGSEA